MNIIHVHVCTCTFVCQALRRQYAGAIPLSEQEKQVELVLGLREKHREVERLRKEARTERDIAKVYVHVCTYMYYAA